MKKILITGASGFIGSFFVEEALRRGWIVWAGIRKTSSRVYLTNPEIKFIELMYDDPAALAGQVAEHALKYGRWDYIIHCAGITKSARAYDFERINYIYTRNLAEALKKSGNVPCKFIYMSTLSVFGPGDENGYSKIRPGDMKRPNTAYGRSKLKAEQYIKSLDGFPYIFLRPTGVYGPSDRDYYAMVEMVKHGLDVSIGLKPQLLDFIYVKDLVKACFLAIDSSFVNKAWFVSDGESYSSDEFTFIIRRLIGRKHVLNIRIPLFAVYSACSAAGWISRITSKCTLLNTDKYRILKQRNWTCDISSIQEDLGFIADYDLEEGLEETIGWYRENGWL